MNKPRGLRAAANADRPEATNMNMNMNIGGAPSIAVGAPSMLARARSGQRPAPVVNNAPVVR